MWAFGFLPLLFLAATLSHAEPRWDPEYPKTFQVKGGLSKPSLDFNLRGPGPDVTLVPNSPALPFFALSYRGWGLTVQLPSQPDKESIQENGASQIQDFQLRFFGHRSTHELIYQSFKGYSIEDWKDPLGKRIIRTDVGIQHSSYKYISAVSPAFYSKAVAFDQKGVQFRRGGSLFLWGDVGYTLLNANEPLIPTFVTQDRHRISELTDLEMYSLLVGTGYGYLVPIATRFYATISIFAGAGVGLQRTNLSTTQTGDFVSRVGVRPALGYNYGNHLGGLQLIVDQNTTSVEDGEISQATLAVRFFYGYRFQGFDIDLVDSWLD